MKHNGATRTLLWLIDGVFPIFGLHTVYIAAAADAKRPPAATQPRRCTQPRSNSAYDTTTISQQVPDTQQGLIGIWPIQWFSLTISSSSTAQTYISTRTIRTSYCSHKTLAPISKSESPWFLCKVGVRKYSGPFKFVCDTRYAFSRTCFFFPSWCKSIEVRYLSNICKLDTITFYKSIGDLANLAPECRENDKQSTVEVRTIRIPKPRPRFFENSRVASRIGISVRYRSVFSQYVVNRYWRKTRKEFRYVFI
jgi:hypothetical protein